MNRTSVKDPLQHYISRIILGTAQLGMHYGVNNTSGRPTPQQAHQLLQEAYRLGIRVIDTADGYGDGHGLIRQYQANNPAFRLLTKFKRDRQSPTVEACLASTLKSLQVPSVDTYSFHSFDDFLHYEDTGEIGRLKKEGKFHHLGVSIYTNQEFQKAIESDLVDTIQIPLNLLDHFELKKELIVRAKERGKAIHVRSVFLQGLFFKDFTTFPVGLRPLIPAIERLRALAHKHQISLMALALLYPLQFPQIDGVLFGVDNQEQLRRNIECLQWKIGGSALEELHQIRVEDTDLLNPSHWNNKH